MPEQPPIMRDKRTEQSIRELREALAAARGAVDTAKTICDALNARIAVVDGVLAKLSAKGA